jgi:putative transposase
MTRPRRLEAADYKGYRAYFLTICTHNRTRPSTNASIVALVLRRILRAAAGQHVEILAYCIMPDHLHLTVIAHGASTDVQTFVRLAKQYSGFAFTRAMGGRLWQDSYFDRTVRNVEELPALVEYTIRNPLRAGLARAPADYPYWGSQRYTREELLEFVAAGRRV